MYSTFDPLEEISGIRNPDFRIRVSSSAKNAFLPILRVFFTHKFPRVGIVLGQVPKRRSHHTIRASRFARRDHIGRFCGLQFTFPRIAPIGACSPVNSQQPASPADSSVPHGCLPAWDRADLPEPLPFGLINLFKTIGPGAILLAAAIGGGEWIAGPMATVKFGRGILWKSSSWLKLMSVLFRSILNSFNGFC